MSEVLAQLEKKGGSGWKDVEGFVAAYQSTRITFNDVINAYIRIKVNDGPTYYLLCISNSTITGNYINSSESGFRYSYSNNVLSFWNTDNWRFTINGVIKNN